MKFNAFNPSEGEEEINTDKVDDVHSVILEKAEELRKFCQEYGVNIFVGVEGDKKRTYCMFHIENDAPRLSKFLQGIHDGLMTRTDNAFGLARYE